MSDKVEENTVIVLKKQILKQRCLYLMLYMSDIQKNYDDGKQPFKESYEMDFKIVEDYVKKINNLICETKIEAAELRPLDGCYNCGKLDYGFIKKTYYHIATQIMEAVDE